MLHFISFNNEFIKVEYTLNFKLTTVVIVQNFTSDDRLDSGAYKIIFCCIVLAFSARVIIIRLLIHLEFLFKFLRF